MDMKLLFLFVGLIGQSFSLDNGLALTPPMGWLTWERYRCVIDCVNRPDECISERLILKTADLMASDGFLEAGYDYIGIDDCWSEFERDENQRLVANKKRFPNGMKYVADYVHSKGLKFGIYGDYGTFTCGGYPGTLNHMEIDAQTFADWDVDYVKLDGCYVDIDMMDEGYPYFGKLLNETGRPMLYSCSWPAYQEEVGMEPDFASIAIHCNMWRNFDDIEDSWSSVEYIMNHFGNNSRKYASHAGPGHWNDPDMLIIGNFGLSYEQEKAQMAVWAILAAPLLISTDLANLSDRSKELLLNKVLIDVNQDPLARAGIRVLERTKFAVWKREVIPVVNNRASVVFAIVNHSDTGAPRVGTFSFRELELDPSVTYSATDLLPSSFQNWTISQGAGNLSSIQAMVVPTGVTLLKLTVVA